MSETENLFLKKIFDDCQYDDEGEKKEDEKKLTESIQCMNVCNLKKIMKYLYKEEYKKKK